MIFFYIYSGSCLIDEGESFLLTGGYGAMNDGTVSTVSRYDLNGWVEDLDDLNTKRFGHGCTQYLNTDRAKVWKHIFMMINLLYLLKYKCYLPFSAQTLSLLISFLIR